MVRPPFQQFYTSSILLKDPEWGKGCFAVFLAVVGLVIVSAIIGHCGWTIPRPVGRVVGLLLALAIARWVLNRIFD